MFNKTFLLTTLALCVLSTGAKASKSQALYDCTKQIAEYFSVSQEAANIPVPTYENYDSGEFLFSWPKGSFELSVLGQNIPVSASCNGMLEPYKLQYVSVNGKEAFSNY